MRTSVRPDASFVVVALAAALLGGCGSSDSPPAAPDAGSCSIADQTGCQAGEVCEQIVGGTSGCFAPVTIEGKVVEAADPSKPIGGAHVVARDGDGAAIGNVAISADDGTYSLAVPAPRDADGHPASQHYTLRADAAGWTTFPTGLRVALPIDVKEATGSPPVVANAATTIALEALAGSFGSISGAVKADHPGGTLVVAGSASGVADASGAYTIFNVPAGGYDVHGYAAGVQLSSPHAEVKAGAETTGIDLAASNAPLGRVSGSINLVDAPGAGSTSVVLALEDTFNAGLERGEVPRGLRAGDVTSSFSIDGVPDGKYVILAAFENDGLVRDPDTSIAGTATLHVTVAGAPVDAGNFKVTGALDVVSPGANGAEPVSGTPTFTWADDASEDHYVVQVFDTLGAEIWKDENVPSVKGAKTVSVTYAGPALTTGQYYQFRATSMKGATALSRTEDLKGVFVAE